MARDGAHIAFFGATSLLAREVRGALESRAFRAASVKLYDATGEGTLSEYDGEALVVTRPDEEAVPGLDIAFMCGTVSETEPYLDWPGRRGFVAIDLSGASCGRPGVPLVHTEINPGEITAGDGGGPPSIIGAPQPVSHNLASLAAAARDVAPIESIDVFALRPASEIGEPAIDELYQQTVSLLNFSSVPQEVFGRQVAFNVIPTSPLHEGGRAGRDERLEEETSRLLGIEPSRVSIASALVSVFHGHAMAVDLRFERPPEVPVLRQRLAATRGLRLVEDETSFSPVELAGEESVAFIGPVPAGRRPGRVRFWTFCDNLKGGAALNAVRIAERLADAKGGKR